MNGTFRAPMVVQRAVKDLVVEFEHDCKNEYGELDRDELKLQVGNALMNRGGEVWDQLCRHAVLIAVNAMVDETIRLDRIPLKRKASQTVLVVRDDTSPTGLREIEMARYARRIVNVPAVDGRMVDRPFEDLNREETLAYINRLEREIGAKQDELAEVRAIYAQMCMSQIADVRVRDVIEEAA